MRFSPVSGLSVTQGMTTAEKAAWINFCYWTPGSSFFSKCQDLAADIYEYGQYGGNAQPAEAPGPGKPGSTAQENIDAYIAAQQAQIQQQEAQGYHPGYANYDSLTATNLAKDLSEVNDRIAKLVEYGIAAAVILMAISWSRS